MTKEKYLSKLISFKTDENLKDITNCLTFIANELKANGWKTCIIKNSEDSKPNLVAVLGSKTIENINDGLLLAGHIDTVSTNESAWKTNPFKLIKEDNYYYGLGVSDMKSFTASVLELSLKLAKLEMKKPIVLALTSDEETNLFGVQTICRFFKEKSIVPKYAIIGEPSNMMFSLSNKGFYEMKTIINGVACHSSNPSLGTNAIYVASKFVLYLEKLNKKYKNKETTLNVGIINGGRMCNIVADKCEISWDIRTSNKNTFVTINNKVQNELIKILKPYKNAIYSNTIVFKIPPFEKKEFDLISNTMEKYKISEKPYIASTEAGYYQELGINPLIYGCGEIEVAHAINEKISIKNFNAFTLNLLAIIKDYCC